MILILIGGVLFLAFAVGLAIVIAREGSGGEGTEGGGKENKTQ